MTLSVLEPRRTPKRRRAIRLVYTIDVNDTIRGDTVRLVLSHVLRILFFPFVLIFVCTSLPEAKKPSFRNCYQEWLTYLLATADGVR